MTNEQSLLHCTVRKATSLTKKLIIIGIILLGSCLGGLIITSSTAFAVYAHIYTWMTSSINIIFGILACVPWYLYVIVGVPAGILLYSYLWCVARTLNESDWESDTANSSNLAFAIIFGIISSISVAFVFVYNNDVAFFTSIVSLIGLFIVFFSNIFDFPGAWLHHCRNNKIEVYHD